MEGMQLLMLLLAVSVLSVAAGSGSGSGSGTGVPMKDEGPPQPVDSKDGSRRGEDASSTDEGPKLTERLKSEDDKLATQRLAGEGQGSDKSDSSGSDVAPPPSLKGGAAAPPPSRREAAEDSDSGSDYKPLPTTGNSDQEAVAPPGAAPPSLKATRAASSSEEADHAPSSPSKVSDMDHASSSSSSSSGSKQDEPSEKWPQLYAEAVWAFSPETARRGLPVVVVVKKTAYTGVLVAPYNDEEEDLAGAWWVRSKAGKTLALPDELEVRAEPGLEVKVGGAQGTIESLVVEDGQFRKALMVKDAEGKVTQHKMADVAPLLKKPEFELNDRVDVRDGEGKAWKVGRVNSTNPLKVKVDGWRKAHLWGDVRWHRKGITAVKAAAVVASKETYAVGDKVEVKDAEDDRQQWKAGVVTDVSSRGEPHVKVHGWKKAHYWKLVRKIDSAPEAVKEETAKAVATEAPATPAPTEALALLQEVWGTACSKATCADTGDENCQSEQLCNDVSGCFYDDLEIPPCKKQFKLGDSVGLAPGTHDQGCLKEDEVGVIIQVSSGLEGGHYVVRGGYSDTYTYNEDELVPAWGASVKWIPTEFHNKVLLSWQGTASFGKLAEELPGADINKGFRTSAPMWGKPGGELTATPQPVKELTRITKPPAPAPKPPPPPPPPPPMDPAGGNPPPPPPSPPPVVPPPTARPPPPLPSPVQILPPTAKPVTIIRPPTRPPTGESKDVIRPPTMPPKPLGKALKTLQVFTTEQPTICGEYKEQPKAKNIRGYPLFVSESCSTGECTIFISHGMFWMVGQSKEDARENKAIFKSKEKVKKLPLGKKMLPSQMTGGWQYLGPGGWQDSDSGAVEEPEAMVKSGKDIKKCVIEMKEEMQEMPPPEMPPPAPPADQPPPPPGPGGEEKRKDQDGMYYTKAEFFKYYNNDDAWEKAERAPSAISGGSSELTLKKDQAVVSTKDIILGNVLVVKKGGAGVVVGQAGSKWQVRFLGEFANAVIVPVDSSDITPVQG